MEPEAGKILCTLHPCSPGAYNVVELLARFYPEKVVRTDPYPDGPYFKTAGVRSRHRQPSYDIVLRSCPGPRNPRTGFVFGRNPHKCDITLGEDKSRRISNEHFRIYQKSSAIMLEDFSTNGTWVNQYRLGGANGNGEPEHHQYGNTMALVTGSLISIAPGTELLTFIVRIPGPRQVPGKSVYQILPPRSQLSGRAQNPRLGSSRPVSSLELTKRTNENEKQRAWVTVAEGKDWSIEALSGSKDWKVEE